MTQPTYFNTSAVTTSQMGVGMLGLTPLDIHCLQDTVVAHPDPLAYPSITKARFDDSFPRFCRKYGIDETVSIAGRPVDLHALHTLMMRNGGINRVMINNLFPAIGGALHFVDYPATATEPARAGPGVVKQLQKIYGAQLAKYDTHFVNWVYEEQLRIRGILVNGARQQGTATQPPAQRRTVLPNGSYPGSVTGAFAFATVPNNTQGEYGWGHEEQVPPNYY